MGAAESTERRVALVGNPNTGKTTLFNRLTGLRHKTSNFPGTTLDARVGRLSIGAGDHAVPVELVDLPGVYSLELRQLESEVALGVIEGRSAPVGEPAFEPHAVLVVVDATNLGRNLLLVGETLRRRLPTVVAVNMADLAAKQGLHVDAAVLRERLGCAVVLISARAGEGIDELRSALHEAVTIGAVPTRTPPGDEAALGAWAEEIVVSATSGSGELIGRTFTDRADLVLTHPVLGVLAFAGIMTGLFLSVFWLAQYPMGWIEVLFGGMGSALDWAWDGLGLRVGPLHDLLKDGVIAGVGSTLVFLPQICLLFFLICLLEDTGYLARAAFVMDRALRPFGLPGHSFVPLLSSHACALPGIIAARCIPDSRQRLATILVAPFMTCSARLPVYVLLTGLLFKDSPVTAALAFVGCYALGIGAGVLSALLARRTILRGQSRPMALELPTYKRPSLRNAVLATADRAMVFLKKAGTAILAICIVLWWMGSYPKAEPSAQVVALREQVQLVESGAATAWNLNDPAKQAELAKLDEPTRKKAIVEELTALADHLEHREAKSASLMGVMGRTLEPVFRPLGYDWQLTVGVLASFAAREVFVSTMSVVIAGQEEGDDEAANQTIRQELASATRSDGVTRVFSPATCWSLLVFYVLAMQCLPTLVLTSKESGHIKWAVLQFVWMTAVAYGGALLAYNLARFSGLS